MCFLQFAAMGPFMSANRNLWVSIRYIKDPRKTCIKSVDIILNTRGKTDRGSMFDVTDLNGRRVYLSERVPKGKRTRGQSHYNIGERQKKKKKKKACVNVLGDGVC